ncbi:MAG: HU family DNA-binding protein [Prevotella sp.]|nr:HU family DNA-binding protein [Prevotella sp.]
MAKVNDFARELSEKYGLSLGDASDFVSAMFDVVKEELDGADSSVKIKGFGTFKVSAVGARASVDVNTGERIIIDGRNKISFTPEVLLRDRVNRPFVQFETVVLNDGVDFSEIDEESEEELDSVSETEPQGVQLSPTAPTSQSTDHYSSSETASKAVNTEEHRDMARRLMTPKTETIEEDSEELDDKTTATAPEADDEGIVIGGCRQRSPRIMYVLTIASFIILVSLGIGMYFLYQRIEEKNHVIDRLESRLYAQQEAAERADAQPAVAVKDTIVPNDSLRAAELHAAEKAKKNSISASKSAVEAKASQSSAAPSTATTPSDYNYDTRVRTGAYIIVGVAKTVTVQPGQTLASISKAYLGEGMECYVEVLNNRHSVKAGEKLKIPQLKLKPRKR